MAWKNSSTSGGVGAAPTLTAEIWSRPRLARRPANISSSALATTAAELGRDLLAGLLQAHLLAGRGDRLLGLLARLLGQGMEHRLEARLHLLPDARDGEEPVGPHLGEEGDDRARVVAGGDREAEGDRDVVMGGALGDVRRGQPGDDARALGKLDDVAHRLHGAQQVRVGELHALGRAGRAARVDQREDVVGAHLRGCGLGVEVGVRALDVRQRHAALRRLAVDHDHVLEARQALARLQEGGQQRLLDDGDARPGVGDHVLDLLGGERLVDRERRGAQRHRGEVADVELGTVVEHQRDRLAVLQAELGQPARDRVDALAQLAPGDGDGVALGPDRNAVGIGARRVVEGLDERRRPLGHASRAGGHRAALHRHSPSIVPCVPERYRGSELSGA